MRKSFCCICWYWYSLNPTRNEVASLVNGDRFTSFRRTESLDEALIFIILRGDKGGTFKFTPKPTAGASGSPRPQVKAKTTSCKLLSKYINPLLTIANWDFRSHSSSNTHENRAGV
jgi:hypothetical protein